MVVMAAHNEMNYPRPDVVVVNAQPPRPEELTVTTESLRL